MQNDSPPDLPTRTGSFRAVVRVGKTVMEYSRAGSGRPVVMLGAFEELGSSRSSIQEALSSRFKLVAPEWSPTPGDFAGWLRSFLDGLGLDQVNLLADERTGVAAIGFALLEPERVDRLVLLTSAGADGPALDADLGDPVQSSAHQLLIVSQHQPVGDISEQVVNFLLGDSTPAA